MATTNNSRTNVVLTRKQSWLSQKSKTDSNDNKMSDNQSSMKPVLMPAIVAPKTKVLIVGGDVDNHHSANSKKDSDAGSGGLASAAVFTSISSTRNGNLATTTDKPKRKRQRLDHLSQEEKIMRRKMKNRMAAQSARDRKKMKMQDLETENQVLLQQRSDLKKRNRYLEHKLKLMSEENDALRRKLGIAPSVKQEMDDSCEMSYEDDSTEEHPFDADLDDDDNDESSRSSDYYSSSSMANAFESAELINGSLPKDQASAKESGSDVAGSNKDFVAPHHQHPCSGRSRQHHRHQNHHQRLLDQQQPSPMDLLNRMTCSLQQLTSFLMILLTTLSVSSSINSEQSSVISFVLKQMSQMQQQQSETISNSNQTQPQPSPPDSTAEMDPSFNLFNLMSQPQLISLFQKYQKKVRLRM